MIKFVFLLDWLILKLIFGDLFINNRMEGGKRYRIRAWQALLILYYVMMIFYYLVGKANFPYENLFQNPKLFQMLIEGWIFISAIFLIIFLYVFLSKKANEVMSEVSIYALIGMFIVLILSLVMALTL